MNYSYHQIARTEHEIRNRSFQPRRADAHPHPSQPDRQRTTVVLVLRPVLIAIVNLLTK